MAPNAFPDAVYAVDEKVLCFHRQFLYEAKVLDIRLDEDEPEPEYRLKYRVHYKGWKNTWDDWVPQDRMRKFTDENRELAKSLHDTEKSRQVAARRSTAAAAAAAAAVTAAPSGPTASASTGTKRTAEAARLVSDGRGSRGSKRARESKEPDGIEREDDFFRRPAIKIPISDVLKSILVDDWEKITKENRLVPLPSATPLSAFLDDYADTEMPRRREGSADADILLEVLAGLKEYFNRCVGRLLLYRQERAQWAGLHARMSSRTGDLAGKTVADVYGIEHLLRLFAHTNMDAQAVARLREEIFKMTQFLTKHVDKYLSVAYERENGEGDGDGDGDGDGIGDGNERDEQVRIGKAIESARV